MVISSRHATRAAGPATRAQGCFPALRPGGRPGRDEAAPRGDHHLQPAVRGRGLRVQTFSTCFKAAPYGRRAALCPTLPQALARGRAACRPVPARRAARSSRPSPRQSLRSRGSLAVPGQRQPFRRWRSSSDRPLSTRPTSTRSPGSRPPAPADAAVPSQFDRSCLARRTRMTHCFPSTRRGALDVRSAWSTSRLPTTVATAAELLRGGQ